MSIIVNDRCGRNTASRIETVGEQVQTGNFNYRCGRNTASRIETTVPDGLTNLSQIDVVEILHRVLKHLDRCGRNTASRIESAVAGTETSDRCGRNTASRIETNHNLNRCGRNTASRIETDS